MLFKERLHALLQGEDHPFVGSQRAVSLPIIVRLYNKIQRGVVFAPIFTKNGMVINGHHRYLAARLANSVVEHIPWETSCVKQPRAWSLVDIDEFDWDTPEAVEAHDKRDAVCMEMTLDEFLETLK
jgi:hypothetical protein